VLNLKENKLSYESLQLRVKALEKEIYQLGQIEQARRRENEYLTALHETSLGLIDHLDEEELLEAILQRAAMLTGTRHGYIYLLEPGDNEMQMRVGMGFFKAQLGLRVKSGEGMGGKVWQSDRNGFHGVIGLASVGRGKEFKPQDIAVIQRFADLALVALDKGKLYADVRRELAERKRTEETLRESEERYRLLLEFSPDPIVVYNMQGEATYVNPAFEQTFGFSGDEVLGKQIDFVPDESWPETKDAIEKMLSGKKIDLFETKRLTKDGRVLGVQISSTLYRNRDGKPVGNIVILRDISALKQVEQVLKKYHDHLEELVEARTAELAKTNTQLEQEIEERKRAEEALRKREVELEAQSHHLEEVNTALKVLLKQREHDKKELGENVLSNVTELISPYVERLNKSRLNTNQKTLINIMESNLKNIISPFISKLSSRYFNFTPMEIKVANLVKEGKTNKEIAELLCLSKNTILFHRHNIRSKLRLKNKKINLRSHLLSYDK
jgi:PAS domain S-box-containing protein